MVQTIRGRIFEVFRKYSLPRWLVLLIDISAVYFSFLIAYLLRYNFEFYSFEIPLAFQQDYIVLVVYASFMLLFKSYSGMIRHSTIKDIYKIVVTNFTALVCLIFITLLSRKYGLNDLFNIPISILVISTGAVTILLALFRVFIKMFYEFATSSSLYRKNVLIYGTGDMGILVKRVIEGDPKSHFRLVGFIDDDRKLQGKKVDGYPVFSRQVLQKEFIDNEDIKVFIIAINKIAPTKKREVLVSMIDLGCEILDTPSVESWLNGNLEVNNLKKVRFEDLLGRDPITLNLERIERGLKDKIILITGAAGSIGSEIARQLTMFKAKKLLLVDQAETPSFYLNEELKGKFPFCDFEIIIGDVTRLEIMEKIFNKFRPDIVFHAAAYKHVPVMEDHPSEAFRVNVGGTKIITDLSIKYGVEKFVMISSDKAVNPTNVMGATKKICELLVQAQSKRSEATTQFIITRFGNVLGSNGSVIPVFNKQIEEGGPVTVTHPEVTRFFMTISEACQLVLEAGFMGDDGQIFVFDMGEQIKILDMAYNLIRFSGLEPEKDIKIKYTGLRPGEKLYEELFSKDEPRVPTHHPQISIAQVNSIDYESILKKINDIQISLYKKSDFEIICAMKYIVPEYNSSLINTF
jgi:FlaA1/EpsC-like NDP-sugar epimerase